MSKILVIDDEEEICSILKRFLTKKGYDVLTASDGWQGLMKVKECEPDIVLLDIVMPGMGGIEVLPLVKEINEDIGIIMISALRDVEVGQKLLSMGAADYITKPFDLDYLETSVMAKIATMTPP